MVFGSLLWLIAGAPGWCDERESPANTSGTVTVAFRGEKVSATEGNTAENLTPEKREKKYHSDRLTLRTPAESISITIRNTDNHAQQSMIWKAVPGDSLPRSAPAPAENTGPREPAATKPPAPFAGSLSESHPAKQLLVNPYSRPQAKVENSIFADQASIASEKTGTVSQPTVQPVVQVAARPVSMIQRESVANVRPAMAPPPVFQPPAALLPEQKAEVRVYTVSDQVLKDNVEPAPKPESAAAGNLPSPPSINGSADSLTAAATKTPEKLGEEPRNYNLEFLRRQSVLLRPCEWQLDVGISYLYDEHFYTDIVLPDIIPVDIRTRRRLLTTPVEFRYGLRENVQLFANTQFGWANTEYSYAWADEFYNEGGIGDTNAGASILVHKSTGSSYSPDVVTTFGFTAPTGKGTALMGILQAPEMTLGQGFWGAYWNMLFIHQIDPVILFYGCGSRHYFTKDIEDIHGQMISGKPGDQYTYQMGVGFAMNERITLSTAFFGSYITEPLVAGEVLPGAILEPLYLRFAVTIARPPKRIIEPFAELGLTDDAPNARVGITFTF